MGGLTNADGVVDTLFPRGPFHCSPCGKTFDRAPRFVLGKTPGPRCTCGRPLEPGALKSPAKVKGKR